MKTLIFGDVHGQYDELMQALRYAGYETGDRLIGLGDYIDRGRQSNEVIEFLAQAKKENPSSVFLRGNHEKVVVALIKQGPVGHLVRHWLDILTGGPTIASYGRYVEGQVDVLHIFPKEHVMFLQDTVELYEEGRYAYAHDKDCYRGARILCYGHYHYASPYIGFLRIGLALDIGVAVLNPDLKVIHDSFGREFAVDKRQLMGNLHTDYFS